MKRKRSNSASGPQGNGLDAPVAKKKKKGKKKKVSEGAVNGKPNSQQKPDTAAKVWSCNRVNKIFINFVFAGK